MKPNCMKCQHFYITYDQRTPKGCKAYGIQSQQLPSIEIKKANMEILKQLLMYMRHAENSNLNNTSKLNMVLFQLGHWLEQNNVDSETVNVIKFLAPDLVKELMKISKGKLRVEKFKGKSKFSPCC